MSGGSYNWLCRVESYELDEHKEELRNMRDRLRQLGYSAAADRTHDILAMMS